MFGFGKHKKEIEINEVNENFILIENVVYKRHDEQEEKRLTKIIERELEIIDRLTDKHPKLRASYFLNGYKIFSKTMATISIPQDKTQVIGQLTPLDVSGNVLDISTVQAGSETFSVSDGSVASAILTGAQEGQFTVARLTDQGGSVTVTYTAKNANGDDISGSDDFVIDAKVVVPVLATSLSATFQDPT